MVKLWLLKQFDVYKLKISKKEKKNRKLSQLKCTVEKREEQSLVQINK